MSAIDLAEPHALKAKLFRGFSDPSRLSILEALRDGPLNVSALVERTRLRQPNVSNHLACLLDCGLVAREQRGRFNFYELADPGVDALLAGAESVLRNAARQIEACPRYDGREEGLRRRGG